MNYPSEILFFERDSIYTWIQRKSGKVKILPRTLTYIQHEVDVENSARVTLKHLVNHKFIEEVEKDFMVLSDKTYLPISMRRWRTFLSHITV